MPCAQWRNSAGKSTLMKIIAGLRDILPDTCMSMGEEVVFHSTKDAERKGCCHDIPGVQHGAGSVCGGRICIWEGF